MVEKLKEKREIEVGRCREIGKKLEECGKTKVQMSLREQELASKEAMKRE